MKIKPVYLFSAIIGYLTCEIIYNRYVLGKFLWFEKVTGSGGK